DSVRGPLLVDEGHHHFGRRSNSACAKYADALRKISLARFSSSTSRSNAFTRCRSSVVAPGRVPPSRSAWRTHRRNASAVQPSLPAIDRIAAHCDAWTSACSKTIRTARSRNSGAYRVPVDIGSILSRKEPSDKPGAIHVPGVSAVEVTEIKRRTRMCLEHLHQRHRKGTWMQPYVDAMLQPDFGQYLVYIR